MYTPDRELNPPPETLFTCQCCGHKQTEELNILLGSFYGLKNGAEVCDLCKEGFENNYQTLN